MTITVENESGMEFDFDYEGLANQVIQGAMDYVQFPFEAEVELLVVTNDTIQEINREQREIDAPTDVLSFPMLTYDAPEDFSCLEDADDNFNPDTGEIMLGDIVISIEKVREQAANYGHSEKREFAFLIVHSMLHLFGHDHMLADEAAVMEQRQREILDSMKITRDA